MPRTVSTLDVSRPLRFPSLPVAPQTLRRHPARAALGLSAGAGVLLIGAAIFVHAFSLPWLLVAAPAAMSTAMLSVAFLFGRWANRRMGSAGVDPSVERRILELATMCGGRLTVTSVAHSLSMPLVDASAALSALARTGYVAIENDPSSGVVVYSFPEIEAGLVPSYKLSQEPEPAAPGPATIAGGGAPDPSRSATAALIRVRYRSKDTAALLAFVFGGFGAHKFYLGRPAMGLLYVLTCWTLIPVLAGFFEAADLLNESDQAFDLKYNYRLA